MTEYVYPKRDKSWWGKSRDQLAYWIFCLGGWVATDWYAAMIAGSINLGLDSARRESMDKINAEEVITRIQRLEDK